MTIEERVQRLSKKLSVVEGRLKTIIDKIATTKDTSSTFWNRTQSEIRTQYEEMRLITQQWTDKNISDEYRKVLNQQLSRLKRMNVPLPNESFSIKNFTSSDLYKQTLNSILEETTATYGTGLLSGEKTIIRLARLTQQVNLEEKQVENLISEGFLEKGSINKSKQNLRNELLKKAMDGKYITIVDKNGKEEQWNASSYAELVARTKLIEASTQAVINTTVGVGSDLIEVSSHNTETPYDAQFEGKIFSLSGNDPDFPVATDLPPFHPNCKHTIMTVIKEALVVDGTLDQYVAFSQGTTETHPTRRSHVPISTRGFENE